MKITAILNNGNPSIAGVSKKNGKPWEKFEVELDSGDTATLFGPVRVGEEVETFEDPTYGLQFRKKRTVPGMEGVDKIKTDIEKLTKMVSWLVTQEKNRAGSGYDQAKATADRISRSRPEPPVEHFEEDVSDADFDPAELNELDL